MSETLVSEAVGGTPIPQTSLDKYHPTEVTVRFRRWASMNGTAYMRGQQAGFSLHQVQEALRLGVVELVSDNRETAAGARMVRKGL